MVYGYGIIHTAHLTLDSYYLFFYILNEKGIIFRCALGRTVCVTVITDHVLWLIFFWIVETTSSHRN